MGRHETGGRIALGGVLAAAGLSLNTILDQRALRKQKQAA